MVLRIDDVKILGLAFRQAWYFFSLVWMWRAAQSMHGKDALLLVVRGRTGFS